MAQLKSTIVTGNLQVTEKAFLGGIKTNVFEAPTTSNGTTYGPGTNGNVLLSNGTYIYWGALGGASTYSVSDSSSASAISSSGTGLTTERDVYYGLPTINNAHNYTSSTTIYAPTGAGTAGQYLKASGSNTAPVWETFSSSTVGLGNVSNNASLNSATGAKGDIIYWSAADTPAHLTNTSSSTKNFLSITSQVPAWTTLSKSDVGLSNVENTKLSTWTGSTYIATVGTITQGTWTGTEIAIANGGTGATTAAGARSNLGVSASDHVHGNITNTGSLTATGAALANNDTLLFVDSSDNSKIKQTSIKFDGSTVTQALTPKGTWETFAQLASPAFTGTPTAPTANAGTNTTQIATTAFVTSAIQSIAGPMRFRGTLGATNGTTAALPTASSSNQGDVYKVVDLGNYITGQPDAKNGDMYISDGSTWVYIPSGDETITGTVKKIRLLAGTGINVDDTSYITVEGERTITNTGVISVAEGSTNGTISITTGGTNGTTTNVAVHGLGALAFADTVTITKAQLGLDQVDNVSLLNWTGSVNLTTLGTVGSGAIWHGNVIDIAYGGTGQTSAAAAWTALGGGDSGKHPDNYYALYSHGTHVPTLEAANNAKFLRNDNTWQLVTPANIGAAAINSPAFTGTPTAPTASVSTNNQQIATTAFVHAAISNINTQLVNTTQVTIAASDWNSSTKQCTKTVTGVTASQVIIVSPAAGSYDPSVTSGIYCTNQSTDQLQFTCLYAVPSVSVTINVAMIG